MLKYHNEAPKTMQSFLYELMQGQNDYRFG